MVQKFFDWFYWFIQVGSILAFTVVVYVQQEVSFFYGYLIAAVSMVLATILLLIGRNHYILHPPKGSYLTDTLRIIGVGLRNKLSCRKNSLWTHWLDGAKDTLGGTFPQEMVEGVKSVVRLLPIFLTFIFYWTIFGQVSRRGRIVPVRACRTPLYTLRQHILELGKYADGGCANVCGTPILYFRPKCAIFPTLFQI